MNEQISTEDTELPSTDISGNVFPNKVIGTLIYELYIQIYFL